MRLAVLLSVVLAAAGCKAGDVTDQPGMTKPVEADDRTPIPGEGAASPTTPATDTPAAASTEPARTEEESDPWTETSTDPWKPVSPEAATVDDVTATPALEDPDQPRPDPWGTTSTDPWAPSRMTDQTKKREPLR